MIAEHCIPRVKRSCFHFCHSAMITEKKSFMREVVRRDPSLFFCFPMSRHCDYELDTASIFFASATTWTDSILKACSEFKRRYPRILIQLRGYWREKLRALYAFQQLDQLSSPLRQLDDHIWNKISQHVGLQSSLQVQVYQSAERNLSNYLQDETIQQREQEIVQKYRSSMQASTGQRSIVASCGCVRVGDHL